MRLGIIGLPFSGKTTLFEAITGNIVMPHKKTEAHMGTVSVPDERVNKLSLIYRPKKVTYGQIEYFLPGRQNKTPKKSDVQSIWTQVRDCDAIIHVLRNFRLPGLSQPDPVKNFRQLDQELILSDLMVVEKRLERFEQDKKRHRDVNSEEEALLLQSRELLEKEIPLRKHPELAASPLLRGYGFLSGRPMLVIFNNSDDDSKMPDARNSLPDEECIVVRCKLEREIAQMSSEDSAAFLSEFDITEPVVNRVIKQSYRLLGLISFLTVGSDEVRAWTVKKNTTAQDAAEAIHSDIKKGFIRAEVVSYNDFISAGSYVEAKKSGFVRLEGKNYIVQDGDIIDFRFNVS